MDVVVGIAGFLVNELLSIPAYLVGLIVAVGLIALRRSPGQVIGGGLKAALGFLILGVGADTIVASLEPLGKLVLGVTGAHGVVPTNEAITALAQEDYGTRVAWMMIAGFAVSLLVARLTPLRYVFLTGHHILFMATLLTVVLTVGGFGAGAVVAVGAVLLGVIMVVMPAFGQPWMRKVTGGQPVAIGHFGTLGYIAGGLAGQLVGRGSKSTEETAFPENLRFLRDPMVGTALLMTVIYVVFAVAYRVKEGRAAFEVLGSDSNGAYVMDAVMQALLFGVGVALVLFGVRTILGEIVPAFQGIAAKIVPGAMPALDCPVTFTYAPNAVLVGFVASFVGGLVSLGVIALGLDDAWALALILPGMVPHFFTGGTAGVFGNATGGRRGAVAGGFVNGVVITFLSAFLLKVLGALGFANTTFGDADLGWYGIVVGNAARAGTAVTLLILAVVVAALLTGAILVQRRVVDAGWDPRPLGSRPPPEEVEED